MYSCLYHFAKTACAYDNNSRKASCWSPASATPYSTQQRGTSCLNPSAPPLPVVKLYCYSSIKEDTHHLISASNLPVCSKETTIFASQPLVNIKNNSNTVGSNLSSR